MRCPKAAGDAEISHHLEPADATRTACPACGLLEVAVDALWSLAEVPTQSCRLLRSASAAAEFPRGGIRLLRCLSCGYVHNADFDPTTQHYDADYEESQAYSPQFNGFAAELAAALGQRYALSGKRVLEVGCGKGHFLATLCHLSGAIGLGIDPAFDPARHPAPELARLSYLSEALTAAHADFQPDLLICRHTLEHIVQPQPFLRLLAEVAGRNQPLFLEVPDYARIASEGAFWDIYYEHCAYFDAHALRRACAHAGLSVEAVELGFGDQYLLCDARAGLCDARAGASPDEPPSFATDIAANPNLSQSLRRSIGGWQQQLAQWRSRDQRAVLWGAGSKGVAFLSAVQAGAETIPALTDINPYKQGRYLPLSARPVLAPAELEQVNPQHIVVLNPLYLDEVRALCAQLNIKASICSVNLPPLATAHRTSD